MKLAPLATLAAAGLAAGCVIAAPTEPAPPAEPAPGADTCGAANYQQYVGQRSPQIRLPAGTTFRDYRTGDPVTMDLNPARINFEYDRTGKLVKVSCG